MPNVFKSKPEVKKPRFPRKPVEPQPRGARPAAKMSVALGMGVDNQSHLLGKGPELNYMQLRKLLVDLAAAKGKTTIDGKDIQLASAVIFRPGSKKAKRRSFKATELVVKAATKKPAAPKKVKPKSE